MISGRPLVGGPTVGSANSGSWTSRRIGLWAAAGLLACAAIGWAVRPLIFPPAGSPHEQPPSRIARDGTPAPGDLRDVSPASGVKPPDFAQAVQGTRRSTGARLIAGTDEAVVDADHCADRQGYLDDELARFDAAADGWETEVFYDTVKPRLNEIGRLMVNPQRLAGEEVADFVTEDFSCQPLRPLDLHPVIEGHAVTVLRPARDEGEPAAPAGFRGREGFRAAVAELLRGFDPGAVSARFKIFRVTTGENSGTLKAYFDTDGQQQDRTVQQLATWTCHWKRAGAESPWKLSGIEIEAFEEIVTRAPGGRLFADYTEAVVGHEPCYRDQFLYGTDHWRQRLELSYGIDSAALCGIAVADVNGDGLEDVYISELGALPNRLLIQQPDGTVKDMSAEAGVDWLDRTRASLFVDLNNDGHPDLIVGFQTLLLIMENDGSGRFAARTVLRTTPIPMSITAADFDLDGLLDIYVCNYGNNQESFGDDDAPLPWWDANNGAPNALLRNNGNLRFTDVTNQVGLDQNNSRYSLSAVWEDYDNDGDLDLYVANDFGRNNLYRNDLNTTGRFVDVAEQLGVQDISPGMSCIFGDYDNNGWMDLYIGNMFSGAGNRITHQTSQFKRGVDGRIIANYQRFARGNALFANLDGEGFRDVSIDSATTLGRWAWTSLFFDVNNDALLDLVVVNGYVTGQMADDL
jgi:hypothetical protein